MLITRKEILENEFVEHLNKMLHEVHSLTKGEYFLGEDTEGKRYLCFLILSRDNMILYENNRVLLPHELKSDREDEFFEIVFKDLMMNGIASLYKKVLKQTVDNSQSSVGMFTMNLN
jgi:hypothetical protein